MSDPMSPAPEGDAAAADAPDASASALAEHSAETPETQAAAPAAEGGDFKQLYTLLFCCTALFVATMWLPIEGGFEGRPQPFDLTASQAISGGFLAVFAAYGVLAGWMNVHRNKMIVWPAFFAAADGIYICVMRGLQMPKLVPEDVASRMDSRDWVHLYGSGFYVIAFASLLVIWTLFTGVMAGAKKDAARKEAAKAARAQRK